MKTLVLVINRMFEADCTEADANHWFQLVVTGKVSAEELLSKLDIPTDEATVNDFKEFLFLYKSEMATIFRKRENAELEACGLPLKVG